jgi:hypothetical protein
MTTYAEIMQLTAASPANAEAMIESEMLPALVELWLAAYRASTPDAEIVEVGIDGFSHLFDLTEERLVTAYGFPGGAAPGTRDASRMRGFPKPPEDHVKGHAIAHQLGGGLDINLIPQDRVINSRAFRTLEREAARHPGCLYFSNWNYVQSGDQTPSDVVQGLIRVNVDTDAEHPPATEKNALVVKIVRHAN